jgi:hypothetical protein
LNRRRREKGRPTALEFFGDLDVWRALHMAGPPPRILTDRELRSFVDARLTAMSIDQIVAICRERFGEDRVPSRHTVLRYRRSLGLGRVQRRILRNARIRAFIDELLPRRRSFRAIAAACRERFGDGAPSCRLISDYWREQSGRR